MALLDDVKQYLDISSYDEANDKKIKLIIARAKVYLHRFNPTLDDNEFEDESALAHSLILDYCRYDFSNAAEAFPDNYRDELHELRRAYKVKMYEQEENTVSDL